MADTIWPDPPPVYVPPPPPAMYMVRRRIDGLWYDRRTHGGWRENPGDCQPFPSKGSALRYLRPYPPRDIVCTCSVGDRWGRHSRTCARNRYRITEFDRLYELIPFSEIMRYIHALEQPAQQIEGTQEQP